MSVTEQWIPIENAREQRLVERLARLSLTTYPRRLPTQVRSLIACLGPEQEMSKTTRKLQNPNLQHSRTIIQTASARRNAPSRSAAEITLIDVAFSQSNICVDCCVHEVADPASREATWQKFEGGEPEPAKT